MVCSLQASLGCNSCTSSYISFDACWSLVIALLSSYLDLELVQECLLLVATPSRTISDEVSESFIVFCTHLRNLCSTLNNFEMHVSFPVQDFFYQILELHAKKWRLTLGATRIYCKDSSVCVYVGVYRYVHAEAKLLSPVIFIPEFVLFSLVVFIFNRREVEIAEE